MIHSHNLDHGGRVTVRLQDREIRMELTDPDGNPLAVRLTLGDLEELTDLLMDSFYKAQLHQKEPKKH